MLHVIQLEDRIGAALLLAQVGVSARPVVDGRYDVLELRGRGARGVVCRVHDRKLDRGAALKIYPPLADTRVEGEVAREARALARLEHPNIVRVHDFGRGALELGDESTECLYLAMEFVEGRSLRVWRAERRRPRRELLRVLLAAGEGLAAAHAAGVVHRDFKPENVMIDRRGRVSVVDFGLSKGAWGSAPPPATMPGDPPWIGELVERLTQAGAAVGTLEYMAPEARRGEADERSDQFSFAVTAWELLTGVAPFDAQQGEWRAPSQTFRAADEMPSAIRRVLEQALAYRSSERFASIQGLLRALRSAARARVWYAVAALAGVVGIAGGVSMIGASELVDAAKRWVTPPPDPPACAAFHGDWYFTTVVTWAADPKYFADECPWRLTVATQEACEAVLTLERSPCGGAGPLQAGSATVTLLDDGTLSSPAAFGSRHYNLRFSADTVLGDWALSDRTRSGTLSAGLLRGGRVESTARIGRDFAILPCESRCRLLCGPPAAKDRAQRCIEQRCSTPEAEWRDCGPSDATIDVSRAQANLDRGLEDLGTPTCIKFAVGLQGTWRVVTWDVGGDAPHAGDLTLARDGSGCALAGVVTDDRGHRIELSGVVDDQGDWVLTAPEAERWSLQGWGPAFGLIWRTGKNSELLVAAYPVSVGKTP